MRPYVSPANAVTSANLVAGFVALLVVPTAPGLATAIVLLAAALDVADGSLARRFGGDQRFGAELDSLADMVCFCIVPAWALYRAVRPDLALAGAIVGTVVVLTGAWRLARFPLVHEEQHFVGLPTPTSGFLIMVLALLAPGPLVLVGAAALGALAVSTIRFPTVFTLASRLRHGVSRTPAPHGRIAVSRAQPAGRAGQVLATVRRGVAGRRRRS